MGIGNVISIAENEILSCIWVPLFKIQHEFNKKIVA
jgi:hypothetical protein